MSSSPGSSAPGSSVPGSSVPGSSVPGSSVPRSSVPRSSVPRSSVPRSSAMLGDVDLASVGALLSDPSRCRVLLALADGRALPASVLASEAGVAASTVSSHLGKLLDGGLLAVEPHGRYRYYRLAGPHVGEVLEALCQLAPPLEVRSLREGTRAQAMRLARSCFNHMAGRLGVAVTAAMVELGFLETCVDVLDHDRTAYGGIAEGVAVEGPYRRTDHGTTALIRIGVVLPRAREVKCCVDWTEQRHHVAGAFGSSLLTRFLELDWVQPSASTRALRVTASGLRGLQDAFGLTWPPAPART